MKNFFRRTTPTGQRPGDQQPPTAVVTEKVTTLAWTRQIPYPGGPPPNLATARERVRQHVEALPPGDPGTAAVLDRTILAWLTQWEAQLAAEAASHQQDIRVLIGQAERDLTQARAHLRQTRRNLAVATTDYLNTRQALTGHDTPLDPEPQP